MANISIQTNLFDGVDGSNLGGSFTANLTSSNNIGGYETIGQGWTQLSFNSGSLTNVLAWAVKNDTTTYSASVIAIATGSAGQGIIAYVYPGQTYIGTWNGTTWNNNAGVYVSVVGSWPTGSVTPTAASAQWKVQQI